MSIDDLGLSADESRLPPHDLLAEQSALGGAMLSPTAAIDVIGLVKPSDFYIPKHELIFEAITALMMRGEPTDVVSVSNELSKTGVINRSGGAEYLHTLTGLVPTSANAGYYAQIVFDKAVMRRLIEAGTRIVQMGYSSEGEASSLLGSAREELDQAAGSTRSGLRMVSDIVPDVIKRLEEKTTFVPSPWPTLNAAIGGLRPGCVYLIAARPAVGKSIIAAQLAIQLALFGKVAFSSLEMSEDELVSRMISERLEIGVSKLKDNRMTQRDWEVFARGKDRVTSLDIAVDDRTSVSAVEVRAHAMAVAREGALAGAVVDYVQLMTSGSSKVIREQQVSEFSRQIKVMAKDLRVPVVALSQLNRDLEKRLDGIPRLSDLRESGSLEQDADVVILLRREVDYTAPDGKYYPGESIVLDVAKNRHGTTGEVVLAWDGYYSRAREWTA
jgi:replicative DNA helicase